MQTTYPGVYIQEVPSGVHTIMGVSTSMTAFVGQAKKGDVNKPIVVHSFSDFNRIFGGLWEKSTMSFAVQQYFLNGGTEAIIVRVVHIDPETSASTAKTAEIRLDPLQTSGSTDQLTLEAASPGSWGKNLRVSVNYDTSEGDIDNSDRKLFNLIVRDPAPGDIDDRKVDLKGTGTGDIEILRNLSLDKNSPSFITRVLEQQSKYLRVKNLPEGMPIPNEVDYKAAEDNSGNDGDDITDSDIWVEGDKKGVRALEDADIFNLLCLPPPTFETDLDPNTYAEAAKYCGNRRAMLLVDFPSGSTTPALALNDAKGFSALPGENAAIFFPRIKMANQLKNNLLYTFTPCGAIAGVFARTDSQRGVWKAPAGIDAKIFGVSELSYTMTDGENGELNPLGINCLRTFPTIGTVVWGSRTMKGADALASEWKYIPVRRMALFIEESLYRGTKWVVFEPNDEPLWAQIRLNVGAFMHNLFRQGAFQGKTPKEAYLVKCDKETTTQDDINRGIVNILVGFAPLKPAEFVIIKIQQLAGEIQT